MTSAAKHRRPLAPAYRQLAVLLVALLAVTHTAAAQHEVSIAHVLCAEHGELIDVPIVARTVGADPIAIHRHDDGRVDHAHCSFAAVTHATAASSALPVAAYVAWMPASSTRPPVPPLAAIPSLHLAPKTSPPRSPPSIS